MIRTVNMIVMVHVSGFLEGPRILLGLYFEDSGAVSRLQCLLARCEGVQFRVHLRFRFGVQSPSVQLRT